jgi:hypothetical protein
MSEPKNDNQGQGSAPMDDVKPEAKEKKEEGTAEKDEGKEKKREMKRSPNRLIVEESHGDGDNSCVMLSTAKMEGLRASRVEWL